MTSESRRQAEWAKAEAERLAKLTEKQAAEIAEGAERLRVWLDDDRLAPRLRRAMKLRWGQ